MGKDTMDTSQQFAYDEASGMAAAVGREAAAAAVAAQELSPSTTVQPVAVTAEPYVATAAAVTPYEPSGAAVQQPGAFDPAISAAHGSEGEDQVTRIDFSTEPEGEGDSVIRLDFSSSSDDGDSVVRLDFSSPAASAPEPDAVAAAPFESAPAAEGFAEIPAGTPVSTTAATSENPVAEPPAGTPIGASAAASTNPVSVDPVGTPLRASAAASENPVPVDPVGTRLSASAEPAGDQGLGTTPQPQPDFQVQQQQQQPLQQQFQQQPAQQPMQQQYQQPVQQPVQQQPVQQQFQQPVQQFQQPPQQFQQPVQQFQQPVQQFQQTPQYQQPLHQQPIQQQPDQQFQLEPTPVPLGAPQAQPAALTEEELAADRAQAANKPRPEEVTAAKAGLERIIANVETVVIGKREPVSLVVLALVARGHVLLEDLPGTGKTTLVSALARSIACDFSRIQFTPDIMPSDVSGFSIYNQKTNDFEFRPGGVMSNLVLADEINRASAKTQSALLEAMEERQVTVDGQTYRLPEPFMVLATQNPIEQFGTYPLPEAQVDRFLVKLSMGYPGFDQEVRVLELGDKAKKALAPVLTGGNVLALREIASRVYASRIVLRYIVEVITATRDNPEVQVGSSPRGGIALLALSRAYALLQGRSYVIPDDVKYLAPHVLCHRISLAHEAKVAGRTERQVIESILSGIAVPYYDENEARGIR